VSPFADVRAARGGLDGGEGSPEIGTSGIPLAPVHACRGVVKAFKRHRVDNITRGDNIRTDSLAATTTDATNAVARFAGRHFD